MFPIRDDIPTRSFPYVNYAVIALCAVIYFLQAQETPGGPSLVERYGLIPLRVTQPDAKIEVTVAAKRIETRHGPEMVLEKREAQPAAVPVWLTFVTCIFLHGSLMHVFGNLWFLSIFGDNIEDRFGHVGYLLFYLLCGASASLAHYLTNINSTLPTIGASGAIAGVMGAYLVWYPSARVQAVIPLGIVFPMIIVPAPLFLGLWFVLQLFSGVGFAGGAESGGVAWWAHIGGFVVGAGIAALMGSAHVLRPKNPQRRPSPGSFGFYANR